MACACECECVCCTVWHAQCGCLPFYHLPFNAPKKTPIQTEEDGSETRANEAKQKRANEKDEGKELNLHEQTNNVVVVCVCVYCVQEKANLFINLRRLQSLLESKLIIISQ